MSNPLWTDENIDTCFEHEDDFSYARKMRDEYEARIAELEAQLKAVDKLAAEMCLILNPGVTFAKMLPPVAAPEFSIDYDEE